MLNKIIDISIRAGKAIMDIYNSADFGVEMKSDNSPLTLGDKASNEIIVNGLKENFPEIPILSEEGIEIPFQVRKKWNKFWLVDPLDGTKEFIKKNGEFTVNIALIENGEPTLGVIYAPAYQSDKLKDKSKNVKEMSENSSKHVILGPSDSLGINSVEESADTFPGTLYFTDGVNSSFKQCSNEDSIKINTIPKEKDLIAVKSRSHSSEDEQKIMDKFGVTDSISVGSSLKFCMVAEGEAQIYYRHGPTNEWDVGAGHAIVKTSGGTVEGLKYNKENVLNSSFIVKA